MTRQRHEPTWFVLGVLVCLFVLSVTSPRLWDRAKRYRHAKSESAQKAPIRNLFQDEAEDPSPASGLTGPQPIVGSSISRQPCSSELQAKRATARVNKAPSTGNDKDRSLLAQPSQRVANGFSNRVQVLEPTSRAVSGKTASVPATGASLNPNQTAPGQNHPLPPPEGTGKGLFRTASNSKPTPKPVEETPAKTMSKSATEATIKKTLPESASAPAPLPAADREIPPVQHELPDHPILPAEETSRGIVMRLPEVMPREDSMLPEAPLPAEPVKGPFPITPSEDPSLAPMPESQMPPLVAPEPAKPLPIVRKAKPIEVEDPDPVADASWTEPAALLAQLDDLVSECETSLWATDIERLVNKLGVSMSQASDEAFSQTQLLFAKIEEGNHLADRLGPVPLATKVRRAGYALARRIDLWQRMIVCGGLHATIADSGLPDRDRLGECLAQSETMLAASREGKVWRKYLSMDRLAEIASGRTSDEVSDRAAARLVFDRLTRVPMDEQQRQFITREPLARMAQELRAWAGGPVALADLLANLEHYEKSRNMSDARLLTEQCRCLALSPVSHEQQLSYQIESLYRNANLRVVITGELLNQLMPERAPERQQVNEVVLGQSVHGSATTSSNVRVRLLPDPQRVRLTFEVNGLVSALTESTTGPATFTSDSQSVYQAWKEMELGPAGMKVYPAQVAVDNEIRLRKLSTDFDDIPLVGSLVREVAKSQHEMMRPEMSCQVESKVSARAKEQVDNEVNARLGNLAKQVKSRVIEPLAAMSLGPEVIAAETSTRRASMRLRLATDDQLSAHTPRPMAPGDALASFQVHESVLNNLLTQLGLDGQTLTLPELRRRLAQRFRSPELIGKETENDDVSIAFAKQNAISVHCQDGQFIVALSVVRLAKGSQSWENFTVRAFYRPQVRGLSAELIREDVIHLSGDRLPARSQIALRGVFSKTFSKQRPLRMVPIRLVDDPRMAGVGVTQLVIDDGWIALAMARTESALPPRVARQPGDTQ